MCNENLQLWRVHEISRFRVIHWQTCQTHFCMTDVAVMESTFTWIFTFSCKAPLHSNNSCVYGNSHINMTVCDMVMRTIIRRCHTFSLFSRSFSTVLSIVRLLLEPLMLIWITLRLTFGVMESLWKTLVHSCPDFDRPPGKNTSKRAQRFSLSAGGRRLLGINSYREESVRAWVSLLN